MDLVVQTYNALGQPRAIGKTTQIVTTVGGSTSTTESHQVVGLRFYRMTGADFDVVGDPWPDANGIISLQLVPTNSRTEDKDIVLRLQGREVTFKGMQYLLGFALPNFYFHVTTAYAILRQNGVEVGKRDFIGTP